MCSRQFVIYFNGLYYAEMNSQLFDVLWPSATMWRSDCANHGSGVCQLMNGGFA